jgi:hypothetical protein
MMKTKHGPDFFKLGIRALALFQIYLAYLVLTGAGFGFETLDLSMKASGALMLIFLTYLLWVNSGEVGSRTKLKVALGCVAVGLLPLLGNLQELVMGNWDSKDWVLLAYFLTGSGAVLEMYWKGVENEN